MQEVTFLGKNFLTAKKSFILSVINKFLNAL